MRSFDEGSILAHLPEKLRLDMCLNVHYKTIKNAKLFHGCDPGTNCTKIQGDTSP